MEDKNWIHTLFSFIYMSTATSHSIVAYCWPTMLRPLICALRPMQTEATSHNIVACCWGVLVNNAASVCMGLKSLTGFKLYSTTVNKCHIVVVPCKRAQHVGPNNVGCCWPTMLRPFAWPLRKIRLPPSYRQPPQCIVRVMYLQTAMQNWKYPVKEKNNVPNFQCDLESKLDIFVLSAQCECDSKPR